jgi:flagellar basal body P-ring formation protein FlgA
VIGKKARTIIRANQPVRADLVERVPLVKSGQMVTIVAENEVLKISVSGKARSQGAEGDTIRVQNLSSLKEISARIINATTVQVAF